jgi:hypothetical protein
MRFTLAGEVPRMIVSGTTLSRMVRAGLFLQPVRIAKRNTGYTQTARASDLFAFAEYVFVTGWGARA